MCANKARDGGNAVGAWTILNNDRLAPAFGEALSKQAPRSVGAAARRKWQDDANRPLRPRLGAWRRPTKEGAHECDGKAATEVLDPGHGTLMSRTRGREAHVRSSHYRRAQNRSVGILRR